MLKNVLGAALLMAAAVPTLAAEVGEPAPGFEGKEFLNSPELTMNALRGKLIYYEVFRTW